MQEPERQARIEFLTSYLESRDLQCPGCRYNLRGLRAGMCPECGSELELTVGLTEPRAGAFVAGAVGLGAGLGFNVFILAWFIVMKAIDRSGPRLVQASPLVIGVVLTGIAMWIWFKQRKKLRLRSRPTRWWLVASCFALSIGTAVLFFSVVR